MAQALMHTGVYYAQVYCPLLFTYCFPPGAFKAANPYSIPLRPSSWPVEKLRLLTEPQDFKGKNMVPAGDLCSLLWKWMHLILLDCVFSCEGNSEEEKMLGHPENRVKKHLIFSTQCTFAPRQRVIWEHWDRRGHNWGETAMRDQNITLVFAKEKSISNNQAESPQSLKNPHHNRTGHEPGRSRCGFSRVHFQQVTEYVNALPWQLIH